MDLCKLLKCCATHSLKMQIKKKQPEVSKSKISSTHELHTRFALHSSIISVFPPFLVYANEQIPQQGRKVFKILLENICTCLKALITSLENSLYSEYCSVGKLEFH